MYDPPVYMHVQLTDHGVYPQDIQLTDHHQIEYYGYDFVQLFLYLL